MDPTTNTNLTGLTLPSFPDGQEVYDAIMGQIEPELTSSQLPLLDKKYLGETPQEKQQRQIRYDTAFMEYGKRFTEFSAALTTHVHSFQRVAVQAAELSTKGEEDKNLESLASSMQSA